MTPMREVRDVSRRRNRPVMFDGKTGSAARLGAALLAGAGSEVEHDQDDVVDVDHTATVGVAAVGRPVRPEVEDHVDDVVDVDFAAAVGVAEAFCASHWSATPLPSTSVMPLSGTIL